MSSHRNQGTCQGNSGWNFKLCTDPLSRGRSDGVLRPADRTKVNADADQHIRILTLSLYMNFTFVRAERSQEENQERAFIAASRRQDRDFKQRLESLQKASELHFARTGKRFEVTQAQVEHNGPLMELGDDERRRREALRYAPYMLNRRGEITGHDGGNAIPQEELPQTVSQRSPQNGARYHGTLAQLGNSECSTSDSHEQSIAVGRPEILNLQQFSEEILEEGADEPLEDYSPSFFEMENWQNYHQLVDHDMQTFLSLHFPGSRIGTQDEIKDVRHLETQTTESESIWKRDVYYEHVEDINEDKSRENETTK
jgi:hypothetical protein